MILDSDSLNVVMKNIKAVAFDVDGVLTDGSLTFLEDGREIKTYSAKDGLGIVLLNKAGIITSIITARDNGTVSQRAKTLKIKELFMGQKNKVVALEQLCEKYNLSKDNVAYMGDDLPDICVLERVGLSACPKDAVFEVKQKCNFISSFNGGKGAVRELCDLILKAKKISYDMLDGDYRQ